MKRFHRTILHCGLLLATVGLLAVSACAQEWVVKRRVSVGTGWHPWYEIKSDPEGPENLILCGTKWDALHNSPFGFVYTSADGGTSWKTALEDRNSNWVTEQSCAFGPNHRAYFVSESSRVFVDGELHHGLGTTRLYFSHDSGKHWEERTKTAWADWSTSAVSLASGSLHTFFNAPTGDPSRNLGSNIGLLIFSPDDSSVTGPFFDAPMQRLGYQGVFPSDAIALKSGAVAALYYGIKLGTVGKETDLGIIRADQSPEPYLEGTVIVHTVLANDCLNLNDGSLAYDPDRNQLFVVYVQGCKERKIMLSSSTDEGRTWTKSIVVSDSQNPRRTFANPSLVAGPRDTLGILWQERQGAGSWLFSYIRDQRLVVPPIELSQGPDNREVSDDSLWTWVYQLGRADSEGSPNALITLNVRTELNNVWRASGLVATKNGLLAVWSSGDSDGMGLYSGLVSRVDSAPNHDNSADPGEIGVTDVTAQTAILYGGIQHYDSATATLKVCLHIANRGDRAIRVPIRLEAENLSSPVGAVSVLEATNGLAGAGAIWDISGSVTGDRIPSGGNSNLFCLSFRIQPPVGGVSSQQGDDLLSVSLKVLAASNGSE
jgi:hypothetical protein